MKKMNEKNGITLIALVVTIIVLIILAGVSINLVLGKNGIITKSKEAKLTYEEERVKEKIELMLGDYAADRHIQDIKLKEYLENQQVIGKIESVEEKEATRQYTIIMEDYEATIDETTLKVVSIEKLGQKLEIANIETWLTNTTTGTEEKVGKHSVKEGTPLKITFDASIEGGTVTQVNKGKIVNGKIQYTTDGNEKSVTFTITGTVDGKNRNKTITITLEDFYIPKKIAETVQVGDFVNYSVGNWTAEDIQKLGSNYNGKTIPTVAFKFGGYEAGNSKDDGVHWSGTIYCTGWRVLSKNEDGTINLIHSGTPEILMTPFTENRSEVESGIEGLGTRNVSMYEDSSTNSVSTNFAVPNSAHWLTTAEFNSMDSTLQLDNISTYYHYEIYNRVTWYSVMCGSATGTSGGGGNTVGLRPVVTIKNNIKATAKEGQTTHNTPETAWQLTLLEE